MLYSFVVSPPFIIMNIALQLGLDAEAWALFVLEQNLSKQDLQSFIEHMDLRFCLDNQRWSLITRLTNARELE
jgi:hypothetical protein